MTMYLLTFGTAAVIISTAVFASTRESRRAVRRVRRKIRRSRSRRRRELTAV